MPGRPFPAVQRRLIVAVTLTAFALAAAATYYIEGPAKEAADATASSGDAPTCTGETVLHPTEGRCVDAREACHAFLNGSDDREVSCRVASDGQAHLQITLSGEGTARIRVFDGAGRAAFERTDAFSSSQALDVTGTAGEWMLRVRFDASGSARIVLWG